MKLTRSRNGSYSEIKVRTMEKKVDVYHKEMTMRWKKMKMGKSTEEGTINRSTSKRD